MDFREVPNDKLKDESLRKSKNNNLREIEMQTRNFVCELL